MSDDADTEFSEADDAVVKAVAILVGEIEQMFGRWQAVHPAYIVEVALLALAEEELRLIVESGAGNMRSATLTLAKALTRLPGIGGLRRSATPRARDPSDARAHVGLIRPAVPFFAGYGLRLSSATRYRRRSRARRRCPQLTMKCSSFMAAQDLGAFAVWRASLWDCPRRCAGRRTGGCRRPRCRRLCSCTALPQPRSNRMAMA